MESNKTNGVLDVVTFGESMGLLMPLRAVALEQTELLVKGFGGAESNVAIGLARMGSKVGWFGRMGNDPFGRTILKTLRSEGVDVSAAALTDEGPTGVMFRDKVAGKINVYYNRKQTAASVMKPEHLDEAYIASAKVLHITGITAALSESCRETLREAIRLAKKNGVKVSFDPNLRLKLWTIEQAREFVLPVAAEVDYFLPGLDELRLLYNTEDERAIFNKLHEMKTTSIVKGGEGATYVVQNGQATPVRYELVENVVDTVGAGDAFCAGFLAGITRGMSDEEAVRQGNLLGSMIIQIEGDWEGMPTYEEVQAKMNNAKHIER
ncbi:sugar kinase [Xylanibacillus composti]|uniref:2-dehydro-3-deoxygluconokinase n=1 Tax=Xylanibacillus composti TaxID=1572762 RepID=A0A8J4M2J0_9BACL|nr:sugar kinase [Xylanibacillus composti]MDT9725873.1 sugar kinase [Xylanibacillus composti]GIQ69170.1 2-dehydro-3-deoxygluconokinase [Xylanibacillus composti]